MHSVVMIKVSDVVEDMNDTAQLFNININMWIKLYVNYSSPVLKNTATCHAHIQWDRALRYILLKMN